MDPPDGRTAIQDTLRLLEDAESIGFSWTDFAELWRKFLEEQGELHVAVAADHYKNAQKEELGDVLFVVVNVARWLGLDPESALHAANEKFARRLSGMRTDLSAQGTTASTLSPEDFRRLWQKQKEKEVANRG